jgi:hypothetical protein
MKCFVESCNKEYKNNLSVCQHIKISAINCLEHKQYLVNLKKAIIEKFNEINLSSYQIAKKFHIGSAYINELWKNAFSEEKFYERSRKRRQLLNLIRKEKNQKTIICKCCKKNINVFKNNLRLFCNKECYHEYQRLHPEEFSFTKGKSLEDIVGKERAKQINEQRSLKIKEKNKNSPKFFIVCSRCKKTKQVSFCAFKTFKQRLQGKKYYCRKCYQIRKYLKATKKYKCSNCKKEIRRYRNEEKKLKHVFAKSTIKFCNKKCYLEYYRSHPQRYKKQREHAGFVSIKSFRDKRKFEYAGIRFSSESEKQCAIFLEKEFNLKLEEGKTCHVKINKIEVDFLLNNIVIEYHQCHNKTKLSLSERIKIWRESHYKNKFRYEYRTVNEYSASRKKKLHNSNLNLIVIQHANSYSFENLKEKIWKLQKNKLTTSEKL